MDAAVWYGRGSYASSERGTDVAELVDREKHSVFLRGDVCMLGSIWIRARVCLMVCSGTFCYPLFLWRTVNVKSMGTEERENVY